MADLKSGVPIVRALDRGLALLAAFSRDAPQLSLSELAKRSQLDIGTTRRLLQTLAFAGFVAHNDATSQYYLTKKIFDLASAVQTDRSLKEVGSTYLSDLAEATGATAFLWLYSEGMALCVDRVRSTIPNVDATWFAVGAKTTLNGGGGPRVLLAFISEKERQLALSIPMISRTPASVLDSEMLLDQAALIRSRGWDLAVDDFVFGLAGLGVPIFTSSGSLAGAISISTLTTSFGDPGSPLFLERLKSAASAIGNQL